MHPQGSAQRRRSRRQGRLRLGETHALQPRPDPLPPRGNAGGPRRRKWTARARSRWRPELQTHRAEVRATIDRIVHFAGWADKYEQVLGSVNPVATPHFNFTVTEPVGIVGVLAPENAPLLGLMTLILPAITAGNSVVALASASAPTRRFCSAKCSPPATSPAAWSTSSPATARTCSPPSPPTTTSAPSPPSPDKADATALQQGAADSVKRVKIHPPGNRLVFPEPRLRLAHPRFHRSQDRLASRSVRNTNRPPMSPTAENSLSPLGGMDRIVMFPSSQMP